MILPFPWLLDDSVIAVLRQLSPCLSDIVVMELTRSLVKRIQNPLASALNHIWNSRTHIPPFAAHSGPMPRSTDSGTVSFRPQMQHWPSCQNSTLEGQRQPISSESQQ